MLVILNLYLFSIVWCLFFIFVDCYMLQTYNVNIFCSLGPKNISIIFHNSYANTYLILLKMEHIKRKLTFAKSLLFLFFM